MKFEAYLAQQKATASDTLDLTRYLSQKNLKMLELWLNSDGNAIKKIIIGHFGLQDECNAHEVTFDLSQSLGHTQMQSRDEILKKLASMLSSLANLQELSLKENEWNAAETSLFLASLKLAKLKYFTIDDQRAQLEGLKQFLQRHQYIFQLSIRNIYLHEAEFCQLLEVITDNLPYLKELHLNQSDELQQLIVEKLIFLGQRKNYLESLTYNDQTPDWFLEQINQHKAALRQAMLDPKRRRDQLFEALSNNNLVWFRILLFANQSSEVIEAREKNFKILTAINKQAIEFQEKLLNEAKKLLELHGSQSINALKVEFNQFIQIAKQETTNRVLHAFEGVSPMGHAQDLLLGIQELIDDRDRQEMLGKIEERKLQLAEAYRMLVERFEYFKKNLAKLKSIAEQVRKDLQEKWPLNIPEDYAKQGEEMKCDLCRSASCLREEEQARETGEVITYSTLDQLLINAYHDKRTEGFKLLLESGANPYAQRAGDTSVFVRVLRDVHELGLLRALKFKEILISFTQSAIGDCWPHLTDKKPSPASFFPRAKSAEPAPVAEPRLANSNGPN